MKNHNKAFGAALRRLRKQHGHTQETLAFACDLDRTYISLLELGSSSPTLDTLFALSAALGLSLAEFARHIEIELHRHPQ